VSVVRARPPNFAASPWNTFRSLHRDEKGPEP